MLYDEASNAVWSTGSAGNPGSRVVAQDDGNIVIYRPDGKAIWDTNTVGMVVHFKTLVPLTPEVQNRLDTQFNSMDELFAHGRINVTRGSDEDLSGVPALSHLANLRVSGCVLGTSTLEQNALFTNRNGAGPRDMVVYVVDNMISLAGNLIGCASLSPGGLPGCVIVDDSWTTDWTTAHEVGHVLGLFHVFTPVNGLMLPDVPIWTPVLSAQEYSVMKNSPFTPIS